MTLLAARWSFVPRQSLLTPQNQLVLAPLRILGAPARRGALSCPQTRWAVVVALVGLTVPSGTMQPCKKLRFPRKVHMGPSKAAPVLLPSAFSGGHGGSAPGQAGACRAPPPPPFPRSSSHFNIISINVSSFSRSFAPPALPCPVWLSSAGTR